MRYRYVHAVIVSIAAILSGVALYVAVATSTMSLEQPSQSRSVDAVATDSVTLEVGTTTILFTGDVFLGRDVERRIHANHSLDPFAFLQAFPDRDATVINFEAAVPAVHQPTPDFGMQFSVSADLLSMLADAGVTHAGLANNHTYDHGRDGYQHTIESLALHDIVSFGHPSQINQQSVTIIDTPHIRIGLLGIHTLYGQPSLRSIADTYTALAVEVDMVVAYVHWGEEYMLKHNPLQRALAEQLVGLGVDLIIGHHPHVVQGIELIDGVPVLYSLGNTIFDQYFSDDVQVGMIASLQITADRRQVVLTPIDSRRSRIAPQVMNPAAATAFLTDVAERGGEDVAESVRAGVVQW